MARTIETVRGGGIIVLLLKTITSLKQLYTMSLNSQDRYRTGTRFDTVSRFNERFLLSLATNPNCLVITDELDVVPFSQHNLKIEKIERTEQDDVGHMTRLTEEQAQLNALKAQVKNEYEVALKTAPAQLKTSGLGISGPLVSLSRTVDQAKALQAFISGLVSYPGGIKSVVSLTAARGRGKSATMGLAIAAAVSSGLSNVFITSPSPDNLHTLFEFVLEGFKALGYTDRIDFDLLVHKEQGKKDTIVRINVHKISQNQQQPQRQTILYVAPGDAHLLGQAELVVIDEAAAIPLPLVQSLISGPHLTWMASTINGYEGTGRSLSLKLLNTLRESSCPLKEFKLEEPIRYSAGDHVERWLNSLLCLDIPLTVKNLSGRCPHPDSCELYALNRDTLFSFHKASEAFLQRMMTLYVASHYKNTPNDLQLMSDAPAHKLFVLLAPMNTANSTGLPEILAVIQVALEGSITRQVILNSFARGKCEAGDLIPMVVAQQFQEEEFASLSGARVVRIAVHPEMQGMGYGTRALKLLERFYRSELLSTNPDDVEDDPEDMQQPQVQTENVGLMNEVIKPRASLKPLLTKVTDIRPPRLDWIGVSFGLTAPLFKFYNRLQYLPVYLRQTVNPITGEHSTILLKSLNNEDSSWLTDFNEDFKRRFMALSAFQFKTLPISLGLDIIDPRKVSEESDQQEPRTTISPYDLKRLESYANNQIDYHMILDLMPALSRAFFLKQLPRPILSADDSTHETFSLSPVQSAILFALGIQYRIFEDMESEIKLPTKQILPIFAKIVRKFVILFRATRLAQIASEETPKKRHFATFNGSDSQNDSTTSFMAPHPDSLEDDLNDGSKQAMSALKEQQRALIDSLQLDKFAIDPLATSEAAWSEELGRKSKNLTETVVSVPRLASETSAGKSVTKELFDKYVAVDHSKTPSAAKKNNSKHGGSSRNGNKKSKKHH